MKLPHGPVTEWNMEMLSEEVLQHEYELAYEVLNDIIIDDQIVISGMLKKPLNDMSDLERHAVGVWKKRLQRAEDELERRFLLS